MSILQSARGKWYRDLTPPPRPLPSMKALWIKTSGEYELVKPAKGVFSLEELQRFVGGYIEIVWLSGGMAMVVNEEGLLYQLPGNQLASVLAGQQIVGDAVICNEDQLKD